MAIKSDLFGGILKNNPWGEGDQKIKVIFNLNDIEVIFCFQRIKVVFYFTTNEVVFYLPKIVQIFVGEKCILSFFQPSIV